LAADRPRILGHARRMHPEPRARHSRGRRGLERECGARLARLESL